LIYCGYDWILVFIPPRLDIRDDPLVAERLGDRVVMDPQENPSLHSLPRWKAGRAEKKVITARPSAMDKGFRRMEEKILKLSVLQRLLPKQK